VTDLPTGLDSTKALAVSRYSSSSGRSPYRRQQSPAAPPYMSHVSGSGLGPSDGARQHSAPSILRLWADIADAGLRASRRRATAASPPGPRRVCRE
jgi:hypothetical protein